MNRPLTAVDSINAGTARDLAPTAIIEQLGSILIGKEPVLKLAVACLLARGHLLIEDVPGVGKTTLAQALAAALGLPWKRLQFTSDLLPADIVGVSIYQNNTSEFVFKPGPVFTSVLLADEINRAPPRAQSALLEAMEERQVSVDGETHALPDPFFVIATQNVADQTGAFSLPESQLDRFLVGLSIGYPDSSSERQLLQEGDTRSTIDQLQCLPGHADLRGWFEQVQQVTVSDHLLDYTQALIEATRSLNNNDNLSVTSAGLSPRAGLNLLNVARAWAFIEGSNHVLPEHLQAVFPAVAGHRLAGSVATGKLLATDIMKSVELP